MSVNRRHLLASAALPLATAALAAPTTPTTPPPAPAASPTGNQAESWNEHPALASAFAKIGTRGVFVAYDAPTRRWITSDAARAFVRYTPASTHKIVGTLLALDQAAVQGPDTLLKWDGTRHERSELNRDLTLRSAYQVSALWAFQQLARRIGPTGMRTGIQSLRYGSANVGEPGEHDKYWINGRLTISAVEQVDFLRRLSEGRLPVTQRTDGLARSVMLRETTAAYKLYAKTGWSAADAGKALGWFVGWVERTRGGSSCFALNLDITDNAHGNARVALAMALLRETGLLG